MPMNKPHLEFHRPDLDHGWATPEGYPSGIQQKILASDIDERRKTGSCSRLLRFAGRLHDLHRSSTTTGRCSPAVGRSHGRQRRHGPGRRVVPGAHLCVPSTAAHHGRSNLEGGCMLFEIHYYDESARQVALPVCAENALDEDRGSGRHLELVFSGCGGRRIGLLQARGPRCRRSELIFPVDQVCRPA